MNHNFENCRCFSILCTDSIQIIGSYVFRQKGKILKTFEVDIEDTGHWDRLCASDINVYITNKNSIDIYDMWTGKLVNKITPLPYNQIPFSMCFQNQELFVSCVNDINVYSPIGHFIRRITRENGSECCTFTVGQNGIVYHHNVNNYITDNKCVNFQLKLSNYCHMEQFCTDNVPNFYVRNINGQSIDMFNSDGELIHMIKHKTTPLNNRNSFNSTQIIFHDEQLFCHDYDAVYVFKIPHLPQKKKFTLTMLKNYILGKKPVTTTDKPHYSIQATISTPFITILSIAVTPSGYLLIHTLRKIWIFQ